MSEYFQLEDDSSARRVLYGCAFLLIAIPFLQAVSQIWPLQLGNIQWRFSAANALSSILLLPFLGMALLLVMSRMVASRGLGRAVGIIAALFAVGLVASLVLFVLDGLQLKAIVSSAQMAGFQSVFARVTIVTVLFTIMFSLLAVAGLRSPKGSAITPKRTPGLPRPADEGVGLIVGRS